MPQTITLIFLAFKIFWRQKTNIYGLVLQKGYTNLQIPFGEKYLFIPVLRTGGCLSIIEANGELYCNYRHDIVCRKKDGKWIHIASESDYGSVFNIMSLHDNQIWISTSNNIYTIIDYHLVPLYKENIRDYFTFHIDSKNRLWIAGNNFVKISRPNDWQHFSDSIFNAGYHFLISEDSDHNIWIGKRDGLLKIKDIGYTIIDKNIAGPLQGLYNIIPLADNRLLLSGVKNGEQVFADNRCTQIMPPRSPGNQYYYGDPVDAYAFDDKKRLWMVTDHRKLLHFNGETLEDFSDALHLRTAEGIYDMDFVKSRKQFFICADSTLLYGTLSKFSTFIPRNTSVPIHKPTLVHGLKNGLILLYVEGRGIYGIDEENNFIPLIKETGIDGRKKRE